VLQSGVGGQNRVVRFDDRGGHLGSGVNRELELALLSVVGAQPLQQQTSETGSGTSTERVEDEESLETLTVVGELADSVAGGVDKLLSNSVMTTSIVVGGVLFSVDEGFRVEELTVLAGTNFVYNGGLEIDVDGTRDVFA